MTNCAYRSKSIVGLSFGDSLGFEVHSGLPYLPTYGAGPGSFPETHGLHAYHLLSERPLLAG